MSQHYEVEYSLHPNYILQVLERRAVYNGNFTSQRVLIMESHINDSVLMSCALNIKLMGDNSIQREKILESFILIIFITVCNDCL